VIAMSDSALSFEHDVKPLFRESDRTAMSRAFDLWSVTDVAAHGDAIVARLREGSMPCDGPWPAEQVDVVSRWLAEGAQP
jgi:hypothetical protein